MITASNLTIGGSLASQTSLATASISPNTNYLALLTVHQHSQAGGTPNTPTATGASMTWTQVITHQDGADNSHRITTFRALSASPGSGAITIDFGGQTQNEIQYTIDQFTGMDFSGVNGANAIVQSAANDAGNANSLTVTLNAFASLYNAAYGASSQATTATITHGTGFTEIATFQAANSIESQYSQTSQTSVSWTSNSMALFSGVAIELKTILGGLFPVL